MSKLYTSSIITEEMDKFLDTQTLPILNHEEIKNVNRTITSNDIESGIKSVLKK
jgi:hypothetical protein